MKIETERLVLREMRAEDYDALHAVLADSDIMQHYPYTFEEARVRGWIARNIERYKVFGFGLWAVCLKETAGMIRPEIGYHIRGDQQRKGYAREAATAVRDWTFKNTPFGRIYSYMKATNLPSARTAVSWGCHFAGEYPDDENGVTSIYEMSREEWKALQTSMEGKA